MVFLFLWSRLALPASGILFYVGAVTFVLGIALDMLNIPAQTMMQQQAREVADILGVEIVMYILAAAMLVFSWWAARYSHR